jgi:uncharacterized protein (TIGR03118 family)
LTVEPSEAPAKEANMDIKGKLVRWIKAALAGAAMAIGLASCGGGGEIFIGNVALVNNAALATKFTTTVLVSDSATAAPRTDSHLITPWGIALDPFGFAFVANNGTSTATSYDGNGVAQAPVVDLPSGDAGAARPTGVVFNGTRDFRIEQDGVIRTSQFIFAGEGGTLTAWTSAASTNAAVKVADGGANGPVYKGLAITRFGGENFLYAADFRNNSVDVFDARFDRVRSLPGRFRDPRLPDNYAPFAIMANNDRIYVAYAKQAGSGTNQETGNGLGVISVFDTGGVFIGRLVTGDALNAPSGMVIAPGNFGTFSRSLLVSNFGDGKINAFNAVTGRLEGTLSDTAGRPIVIGGLRGIAFGNGVNFQPVTTLFFTAGPSGATQGQYGRVDIP